MLRLHYVPGGHGSPVCPKRSAPWDFWSLFSLFSRFVKFYHGLPRYPWRVVGVRAAESRRLKGALRFGLRSTTDASTFPPGPSRSDRVPHVSHILIKVWHVFHVLPRLSTHMKRGHRAALEHVCAHDMKRRHPKQDSAEGSQWWAPSHPPKSWWRPWGCPSLSRCVFFSLLMHASGSGSSSATWSAAATLIDPYPKFNHNPTLILTLILILILIFLIFFCKIWQNMQMHMQI